MLANHTDADDVVANAFASTFLAIRAGKGPVESFGSYLAAAVRNAALALVRSRRYSTEVPTAHVEASSRHVDVHNVVEPALAAAFAALPGRWQRVLWRVDVDGVPPREVASELATTPNSVAALSRRARVGLRKELARQVAVTGDPHDWVREHFARYRSGMLPGSLRELLEEHLASCLECHGALHPVAGEVSARRLFLGPDEVSLRSASGAPPARGTPAPRR